MLLADIPILEPPLEATLRDRGLADLVRWVKLGRPLDAAAARRLLDPATDPFAVAALTSLAPPVQSAEPAVEIGFDPTAADWFEPLAALAPTVPVVLRAVRGAEADETELRAVAVVRLGRPTAPVAIVGLPTEPAALASAFGARPFPST